MKENNAHTFWGNEWIKSLLRMGRCDRVEQAMQQARSWSVKDFEVTGNMVKGKVMMTSRKGFYLHFFITPLAQEKIDILQNAINSDKLMVTRILNHELDPKLSGLLESLAIDIFPSKWSDFKMFCSCPAWVMPCDHIYFLLYWLSFEIDKDPFLVFSLRGVNLLDMVKADEKEPLSKVKNASDLFSDGFAAEGEANEAGQADFQRIDLTKLNDIGSVLNKLLPPNPPFFERGDFAKVYCDEMAFVANNAKRVISGRSNLQDFANDVVVRNVPRDTELSFSVNEQLLPSAGLSFQTILEVNGINGDDLMLYRPSVFAMQQTIGLALHLIACGALIPQPVGTAEKRYAIVWEPAAIDASVSDAMDSLSHLMPRGMLRAPLNGSLSDLLPMVQARLLLCLTLGKLIERLSHGGMHNEMFNLFFKGGSLDDSAEAHPSMKMTLDGLQEMEQQEYATLRASQIKSWTDHLTISTHAFSPVILVDSENNEFVVDLATEIEGTPCRLEDVISNSDYESIRYAVLNEVVLLSPYLKELNEYIRNDAKAPIRYTMDEFADFLMNMLPAIKLLNIKIVLPRELKDLVRPDITMRISRRKEDSVSGLNLAEMLEFDWQVVVGDEEIPLSDFAQMASQAQRLIKFKDRYIYIDESDIKRLNEVLKGKRKLSASEKLQAALGESYEGCSTRMTPEVRELVDKFNEQPEVPVPRALKGKLRPYQKRGFEWMYRNAQLGFGSVIADDMGLGKTIQVIALLMKMRTRQSKFLVVVPTTLITNWQAELARFAPTMKCFVYHGADRNLKKYKSDILLTTYGVLRSDLELLSGIEWHTMVIDEAQNIKNAETAQSRAARKIKAINHIAMSGTPIENRMSEFWSIMDFANKGYLGSPERFRRDFAIPIQQAGDKICAERFRRITAPFLLRRLKTDKNIINDLPDKIEENMSVALTQNQAALYHQTVNGAMEEIVEAKNDTPQAKFKRQGMVLKLILELKQICNHPALFLKDKMRGSAMQDGTKKMWTPEQSGKTETLMTLLDSIVGNGQKALVFTQFREMGELLSDFIAERIGEVPLFLHGGCSVKERKQMVDEFQNSTDRHIFILSIKAGGTGLNLTAASHVIHYDLWWNPAVEAQATDRAYRIGQHQNVIVHRFITQNTFEEQIDRMLQEKKELADMTVATGENWIGQLSNDELKEILG